MNNKKMSEQEFRERLHKMELQKKKEEMRRKKIRKRFFTIFFVLYLIAMAIVGIIYLIRLNSEKDAKDIDYNVQIQDDSSEEGFSEGNFITKDGKAFISLISLSKVCDLSITGTVDTYTFIFNESNEYARISKNDTTIYVNDSPYDMEEKAIFKDGDIYIPADFLIKQLNGVTITFDEKTNTYKITKNENEVPTFILKKPVATNSENENDFSEISLDPINFKLDLSAYEEYMNPTSRDDFLILVNTDNKLDETYVPDDLAGSSFTRSDRDTRKLRKHACLALEAMLKEANAEGYGGVTVTSAYRSYSEQNSLFQNEIALTGSEEEAAKSVNPPGSSEHQTGLCCDMHNLPSASQQFGNTAEGKWLAENSWKFGYILRYPEDKTDITGISYEPWHFRYVGRYHAQKMKEMNMCLEEYVEYINN